MVDIDILLTLHLSMQVRADKKILLIRLLLYFGRKFLFCLKNPPPLDFQEVTREYRLASKFLRKIAFLKGTHWNKRY